MISNQVLFNKIQVLKQSQINLNNLITNLNSDLVKSRFKIKELQGIINELNSKINSLEVEIKEYKTKLINVDLKLTKELDRYNTLQIEFTSLENEIKKLKKLQEIFEFVVTKFSPNLARRLKELKIVDKTVLSITNE